MMPYTSEIVISEYVSLYKSFFNAKQTKELQTALFEPVVHGREPDEAALTFATQAYAQQHMEFTEQHLDAKSQISDRQSAFQIELECYFSDSSAKEQVIFGGKGCSHRFMMGMAAMEDVSSTLTFKHTPKNSVHFETGDLLMFGPYFSNRFSYTSDNETGLKAINFFSTIAV